MHVGSFEAPFKAEMVNAAIGPVFKGGFWPKWRTFIQNGCTTKILPRLLPLDLEAK